VNDDAADPPMNALDPAVRVLWRVQAAVWWLVLTGVAAVLLAAAEWPVEAALAVALVGALQVTIVPGRRYAHYGYLVGDSELRVRRGWLWRTLSVVLHARVQHVDTRQGPVESMLGLATVIVFTAGSVGAMVAIPGLPRAEAETLRDRLVALSGTDDGV
jgi:uncharacterized protein